MNKTPQTKISTSLRHRAFVKVYKKIALPLMKFLIKHMGGDKDAAEEVFSQTVITAWLGWHTFKHKSSYFTWICRIALNKIADYYRKEVNERSGIISPLLHNIAEFKSNTLSPEEELILNELKTSVKECILLLPPEKQRLLYFRYWKDLSIKKISLILGISERSAEGKIYRAKQDLKLIVIKKNPELVLNYSKRSAHPFNS